MSKIKLRIGTALIAVGLLTGCGENVIPELTEEQQDLVVEYAASTLLKYDKNHERRLITIEEVEAEEQKQEAMKAAVQAMKLSKENSEVEQEEKTDADAEVEEVIDNAPPEAPATLEEALQLEQISCAYTGYEIVDDYPEQGENLYFVMSATEGNKLVVLKFNVSNLSDAEATLDMNRTGVRFKIAVNGEEKNALTTMLLNDLAYYQGTIAAGESTELVLVCEIPEENAQEIATLELIVKSVDNIATISLN